MRGSLARTTDTSTSVADMELTGADAVTVERSGPVTTVRLSRPRARNAVDGPTGADCRRTFTYNWQPPFSPASWDPKICATDLLSSLSPAHPYQCKTFNVKVTRD